MSTVADMVARLGLTWEQWIALPVAERDRLAMADSGHTQTPAERASASLFDLPVEDRLAALHASLQR